MCLLLLPNIFFAVDHPPVTPVLNIIITVCDTMKVNMRGGWINDYARQSNNCSMTWSWQSNILNKLSIAIYWTTSGRIIK